MKTIKESILSSTGSGIFSREMFIQNIGKCLEEFAMENKADDFVYDFVFFHDRFSTSYTFVVENITSEKNFLDKSKEIYDKIKKIYHSAKFVKGFASRYQIIIPELPSDLQVGEYSNSPVILFYSGGDDEMSIRFTKVFNVNDFLHKIKVVK